MTGDGSEHAITLDKAWIYLTDCNRKEAIFFYHSDQENVVINGTKRKKKKEHEILCQKMISVENKELKEQ